MSRIGSSDPAQRSRAAEAMRVRQAVSQQSIGSEAGQEQNKQIGIAPPQAPFQKDQFIDPAKASMDQVNVQAASISPPRGKVQRSLPGDGNLQDNRNNPLATGEANPSQVAQSNSQVGPRNVERNALDNFQVPAQATQVNFQAPPAQATQVNIPAPPTQATQVNVQAPTQADFQVPTKQLDANAITQNAPVGATQAAPADPAKVEGALHSIRGSLDQGFTDWDVTHNDLNNIKSTMDGLNKAEFNQVMDGLSNDELSHMMGEVNGSINGFSSAERQSLFDTMASKGNASTLNRLADTRGVSDNPASMNQLGQAIAGHASDSVKENFIQTAGSNIDRHSKKGIAVANAMGGLKDNPAALERSLGALSDSDLNRITEQATTPEILPTMSQSGHVLSTYDAQPLRNMLDATANINNNDQKGRVFEAASNQLKSIEDSAGAHFGYTVMDHGSSDKIREGMTNLINSDVNGVVGALETNDRDGKAMTNYVGSLLNNGQKDQVGGMLGQLMTGNGQNQNAIDRFTEQVPGTRGAPHYKNAQNLGYMVGATQAAIQDNINGIQGQADMVKDIFGSVLGAAGAFGGAPGAVTSSLVGGLTNQLIGSVTNQMKDEQMKLKDAFRELAYPRSAEGIPYEGPAEDSFDGASGRVID